jgi:hypothetical protein
LLYDWCKHFDSAGIFQVIIGQLLARAMGGFAVFSMSGGERFCGKHMQFCNKAD